MKRCLLLFVVFFCAIKIMAQTDNITRKQSERQTTQQVAPKNKNISNKQEGKMNSSNNSATIDTLGSSSTNSTEKYKQQSNITTSTNSTSSQSTNTISNSNKHTSLESNEPIIGTLKYTPKVSVFKVKGVSFKMIEVRGGSFRMGATTEQGSNAYNDEKPSHMVTLSSYSIGQTEVTQNLWKAVMGNNPSKFQGKNKPVETISINDCLDFISKLNALTGQNFRLPTEAEWEFAARGGKMSRGYKYSGNSILASVAWYADNSGKQTHDVATRQPNELGIYDMSGNVSEWCSDFYKKYSTDPQSNPTGPDKGKERVFRGGGCVTFDWGCRTSHRDETSPDNRSYGVGLRLVLSE